MKRTVTTSYFDIFSIDTILSLIYMLHYNHRKTSMYENSLFEIDYNNQFYAKFIKNEYVNRPFGASSSNKITHRKIANIMKVFFIENKIDYQNYEKYKNDPEKCFNFSFSTSLIHVLRSSSKEIYKSLWNSLIRFVDESNKVNFSIPIYLLLIVHKYFEVKSIEKLNNWFEKEDIDKAIGHPLNQIEIECKKALIEEENKIFLETTKKINNRSPTKIVSNDMILESLNNEMKKIWDLRQKFKERLNFSNELQFKNSKSLL